MSQPDPWSVYNTRLVYKHSSGGSVSRNSPPLYENSLIQRDRALDPIEETPGQDTNEAEHRAIPVLTFPPDASPTRPLVDDHIKCGHCDTIFSGVYRRGNLARHVRHKHTRRQSVTYSCRGRGCHSVFQRADARLVHERKRHPELQRLPSLPRSSGLSGPLTPSARNSLAYFDNSSEAFAEATEPIALTGLDYILQGTETLRIWDQRPVNHAGPLPNLFNERSSDISHSHGQDSVFNPQPLVRVAAMEASTSSGLSDLQHMSYLQPENFESITKCCPVRNCTTRTSFYDDFACHFKHEHMEVLRESIIDQFCVSGCDLSFLPIDEDDILRHMWDAHMLIPHLDSHMNDLDLGAELEVLPVAWSPSYVKGLLATSSGTPEADFTLSESQEILHPIVEAPSITCQIASSFFEPAKGMPGRPMAPRLTKEGPQPIGETLGFSSTAKSTLPTEVHRESRIITRDARASLPFIQHSIDKLSVELEPQVQVQLWMKFFNRWEGILKVLKSRRSESYGCFAPLLQQIRESLRLHGINLPDSVCSEGQRAYTNDESQRPGTKPSRKRSNSSDIPSGEPKRIRKTLYSASGNQDNVQVKHADNTTRETLMELDCIIYKHHLMHGTLFQCPCDGFRARCVSQLRHQHLKPGRARNHLGLICFLERCGRCKNDFFVEEEWNRHRQIGCEFKTQKHNGGVAQWARLYLAKYPNALQIPNPYVGQNVWLTDAEYEEHRQSVLPVLPIDLASDSFLDRRSEIEAEAPPRSLDTSSEALVEEEFGRSAAEHILGADIQNRRSLMRDGTSAIPIDMPALSHKDILVGTIELLTALTEESAFSLDPKYCEKLADQLEKLLRTIRLRQEIQPSSNSSCAQREVCCNVLRVLPATPETASSGPSSLLRSSTQGLGSGSSNEESTQTGSVSSSDTTDRTESDEDKDM